MGYSVFMMEYRGYGKYFGKPTESDIYIYIDAEYAYEYVIRVLGYAHSKIIISGISLGGTICNNMAAAIIIESTFTNMRNVMDRILPFVGGRICKFSFDSINTIKKLKLLY